MRKKLSKSLSFLLAMSLSAVAFAGINFERTSAEGAFSSENFFVRGASIRYKAADGRNGIRFSVAVEKTAYEALTDENGGLKANVSTGTLLLPSELLGGNQLTRDTAEISDTDTNDLWHAVNFDRDGDGIDEAYMQSIVYLWNIPAEYYGAQVSAAGYIAVGETIFYTTTVTRSMNDVATAAVDKELSERDVLLEYLPEHTVSFKDRSGSEINAADVKVKYGGTIAEPVSDTYDYYGWYKDEACTQKFDFTAVVKQNTTAYTKKCVDVTQPIYEYDFSKEGIDASDVVVPDEKQVSWSYIKDSNAIQGIAVNNERSGVYVYFKEPVPREKIKELYVNFRFQDSTNYSQANLILSEKGTEPLLGGAGVGNTEKFPAGGWAVTGTGVIDLKFNAPVHFTAPDQKIYDMVYGVHFDVRGLNATTNCRWMIHKIYYNHARKA